MRRARNLHQRAGVALTGSELLCQAPHLYPPLYEPRQFFRITDCSMSLSRFNSATSFFSRAFSSRSCFTSCASLTSMPPYFALQAWIVCLEIPYSRPTSSILRPASTCFKATIIWASVCRLAPMPSPTFRSEIIFAFGRIRGQARTPKLITVLLPDRSKRGNNAT
jgi:hypothetical protein